MQFWQVQRLQPLARRHSKSGSGSCALGLAECSAAYVQAQVLAETFNTEPLRFQSGGVGSVVASVTVALPNPSLERTSTGKPLGPRAGQCHHPSRGPSAFPVVSAQLKR